MKYCSLSLGIFDFEQKWRAAERGGSGCLRKSFQSVLNGSIVPNRRTGCIPNLFQIEGSLVPDENLERGPCPLFQILNGSKFKFVHKPQPKPQTATMWSATHTPSTIHTHTQTRPPWRPQLPHTTTFPSSYVHENTPKDSLSPLWLILTVSLFFNCWFSIGALPTRLPLIVDTCANGH